MATNFTIGPFDLQDNADGTKTFVFQSLSPGVPEVGLVCGDCDIKNGATFTLYGPDSDQGEGALGFNGTVSTRNPQFGSDDQWHLTFYVEAANGQRHPQLNGYGINGPHMSEKNREYGMSTFNPFAFQSGFKRMKKLQVHVEC